MRSRRHRNIPAPCPAIVLQGGCSACWIVVPRAAKLVLEVADGDDRARLGQWRRQMKIGWVGLPIRESDLGRLTCFDGHRLTTLIRRIVTRGRICLRDGPVAG